MATLAPHARESELASLDELIASAGDAGGVRVVRREAGIGKSALLTASGETSRDRTLSAALGGD